MRVSAQQLIHAPPAHVFAVATDPDRLGEWQRGVRHVRRLGSGPIGVGSRLTGERVVAGLAVRFTSDVTAWEPPHRYTFRVVVRGVFAVGEHRIEPVADERSHVTARLDVRPSAALRPVLARRAVRDRLAAELAADLDALGTLLAD